MPSDGNDLSWFLVVWKMINPARMKVAIGAMMAVTICMIVNNKFIYDPLQFDVTRFWLNILDLHFRWVHSPYEKFSEVHYHLAIIRSHLFIAD